MRRWSGWGTLIPPRAKPASQNAAENGAGAANTLAQGAAVEGNIGDAGDKGEVDEKVVSGAKAIDARIVDEEASNASGVDAEMGPEPTGGVS